MRPGPPGHLLDLGLTEFAKASKLQERLHEVRTADLIGDTLILTEHAPVYTLGRTARPEHLGNHCNDRDIDGIPVCRCDRGGSVTYHGPGQLVGYPILRLRSYCAGPQAYMTFLEEILIRAIAAFGLSGERRRALPGVWIADRKIAALGVRISRGVTRHGFALNVMNDLTPFGAITPCGLPGTGVTSVWQETKGPCLEEVAMAVVLAFQEVFGIPLQKANPHEFLAGLDAPEDPGAAHVNRRGALERSCYSGECHGSA
jgi:lipoyl(octanoyl) transferase